MMVDKVQVVGFWTRHNGITKAKVVHPVATEYQVVHSVDALSWMAGEAVLRAVADDEEDPRNEGRCPVHVLALGRKELARLIAEAKQEHWQQGQLIMQLEAQYRKTLDNAPGQNE